MSKEDRYVIDADEILSWRKNNLLSTLLWQADSLRNIADGRVHMIPDVPKELYEAADSLEALYNVMTFSPEAEHTCEFVFYNNSWSLCSHCGFAQIPNKSGYRYCPNCGRRSVWSSSYRPAK